MSIRILSDETINKIAAGEVIEDPSSVVKELVDNALDAGSSTIQVSVLSGGFQEIRVSDDGEGMTKDDAIICIQRHATKKIQDASDLLTINTMGFRGEALAAIASICMLEICTSQTQLGHILSIQAGKILSVKEKAREKGSSFTVQKLFFNTPARKKFQKSVTQSTSKIIDLITSLMLSNPSISWDVMIDHKHIYVHTPAPGLAFLQALNSVVKIVLKSGFYLDMIEVDVQVKNFSLKGFIGSVLKAKSSRVGQYLFINKRPVQNKMIADCVSASFSTRIDSRAHIPFVLFLQMPCDQVDVNVHPKKIHVRFHDAANIELFISNAVRSLLEKGESFDQKLHFAPKETFFSDAIEKNTQSFTFENFTLPKSSMENTDQKEAFNELSDYVFGLHKHFLLLRDFLTKSDRLLIVDLKRVQKTLTYRSLEKNIASNESLLATQSLLKDQTVQLRSDLFYILQKHLSHLKKLGIELREFGQDTFVIESIYEGYQSDRVAELLEKIALSIQKDKGVRLENFLNLSSEYSLRPNSSYSLNEALALVKQMLSLSKSFTDYQGVSSIVYFDQKQFDYCANLSEQVCMQ